MQRLLDLAAQQVRGRPGLVVTVVAVITLLLAAAATQIRVGVDIADYATGTELSQAFTRVTDEFGTRDQSLTVVVDAGGEGSVLSRGGLELARELEAAARRSSAAEMLAADGPLTPAVLTWARPVDQALATIGTELDQVDDTTLAAVVAEAYQAPAAEQAVALLSQEADPAVSQARGGLILIRLDPDLDLDQRAAASVQLDQALRQVDSAGAQVLPFNQALLTEELEDTLLQEMPRLLAAELVIILVILGLAFRRLSDVLLALVAVAATLVWLFGLVALLGPGLLGITGPFSQMAIAVPILLVGLGVDYSFHLTLRYREERALGQPPAGASSTAVRTVGRALILVTMTTAIGFLANVISPLPPIVDFAIFTAVGITAAMVVMGLLVPSVRHLLDRRGGTDHEAPAEQAGRVVTTMAMAARASARYPVPVLSTIVVLAALGVLGALDLGTEFDQEQFIPADTRIEQVFVAIEDLYGGGVVEQTWILVDADATDPEVANSVLATEANLAEEEFVDTVNGVAQTTSAPGLVQQLAQVAEADTPGAAELPDGLSGTLAELGWTGTGFDPQAQIGELYRLVDQLLPGRLDNAVAADGQALLITIDTSAGDQFVSSLVSGVEAAAAPLRQIDVPYQVVSEELLTQETLDALTASQAQKILFTVLTAGALLILYYRVARGQAMLGFITLVPTLLALPIVLGGMWLLGFTFNALTATIAAIAIGFGVDYGIHLSNRFAEERDHADSAAEAIHGTVIHTGAALVASATTTAGGFSVLMLAGIEPVRQFGAITALTVVVAVITTLFAETSALVLWDRRRGARTVS